MEEINNKISNLEEKIDRIYASVEQTRKYLKWTAIITIVLFVLPLLGLLFVVPSFMTNYVGTLQGLQ